MATYTYPRTLIRVPRHTSGHHYVISLIDPSDAPFINAIGGLMRFVKVPLCKWQVHPHRVARRYPGCCHD